MCHNDHIGLGYLIFRSSNIINRKFQQSQTDYQKLTPDSYMQFLKAWNLIKNQRNKTDFMQTLWRPAFESNSEEPPAYQSFCNALLF